MTLDEAKSEMRAGASARMVGWPENHWLVYFAPQPIPVPQTPNEIAAGVPIAYLESLERFVLMIDGSPARTQLIEGDYEIKI